MSSTPDFSTVHIILSAAIEAALYGAILLTPLWFPKRWVNAINRFFTKWGL